MRHARQDKEEWRGNMELGSGGYASGWWGVSEMWQRSKHLGIWAVKALTGFYQKWCVERGLE